MVVVVVAGVVAGVVVIDVAVVAVVAVNGRMVGEVGGRKRCTQHLGDGLHCPPFPPTTSGC